MTQVEYEILQSRIDAGRGVVSKKPQGPADLEESEIQGRIIDYCRSRGWIVFSGSMAHRTHRTVGENDLHILAEGGRYIGVEVKTARGKPTTDQLAVIAHARKLGHTIHIVRSLEEFVGIVLGKETELIPT